MKANHKTFAMATFLFAVIILPIHAAHAAFTGAAFVGGCPIGENAPPCRNSGNDSEALAALLLGVDAGLVTEVERDNGPNTGGNLNFTAMASGRSGTWSIAPSSGITHIVLKASGWFAVFALNDVMGEWMSDARTWSPDVTTVLCPATICTTSGQRPYTVADFLNRGGRIPGLSHMTGYRVVPIPAAIWLFGAAVAGLVLVARRRRSVNSAAAAA